MRRFLIGLVALICGYLAAAFAGALVPGAVEDITQEGGTPVEIGFIHGPIHVDFLLPNTPETRRALGFATDAGVPLDAPGVAHILVGWGARDFYTQTGTWADMRPGPTLRAITGDSAVLRIDLVGEIDPDFAYPRMELDPAEYRALLRAIASSATGAPLPEVGFTTTDGFHEAAGRFHIFRTCNTWITAMLRQSGIRAGAWTPTPYAVALSRVWHGS